MIRRHPPARKLTSPLFGSNTHDSRLTTDDLVGVRTLVTHLVLTKSVHHPPLSASQRPFDLLVLLQLGLLHDSLSTLSSRFARLATQPHSLQALASSASMSATSSNSQSIKPEAQSSKPTEDNKSSLPSLGALDEDDEFEEFDEQGKSSCRHCPRCRINKCTTVDLLILFSLIPSHHPLQQTGTMQRPISPT